MGKLKKGVVAGALCFALLCVSALPAYAAETTDVVRKITYKEAVEMALKNDISMEDLSRQVELLQDNKSDLFNYGGGGNEPTVPDGLQIVDGNSLAFLSTVYNYGNSIEISELSKEVTKIGVGALVKQYFSQIVNTKNNIDMANQNYAVQIQLLRQGQLKNDLGYMSNMDFVQLQGDTEQAKRNIELLELDLANTYTEFNKLLGLKPTDTYELVDEVEFEPITLSTDIDDYARRKVSSDESLRIQGLNVDSNKYAAKVISESSSVAEQRTKDNTYGSSSRALEEAKKQKSVNIKSAYIQLQQLEKNRDNLTLALETAETALKKAEINFKVGNITQLDYDQAKLGVIKAENALHENLYTHDLLKYSFANPCILGNVGGGK